MPYSAIGPFLTGCWNCKDQARIRMEEEYLDMKMRGDASGRQSLLFWHAPEQWERSAGFGFTCLIGLQLFVRMEGARQVGAANYVVTPESGRSQSLLQQGSLNLVSKNLLARSRWGHSSFTLFGTERAWNLTLRSVWIATRSL